MNGSDAVHAFVAVIVHDLVHLMTDFIAMRQSGRGADVSRDEDALVPGDDASRPSAIACASRSDHVGDGHEVFVPRRASVIVRADRFDCGPRTGAGSRFLDRCLLCWLFDRLGRRGLFHN